MDNRCSCIKKILVFVGLIFFGCSSTSDTSLKEALAKNEGWVDAHTYRITAEGKFLQDKTQPEEKKQSALQAAQLHAQFKLRQILIDERKHTDLATIKKIKRVINQGQTIYSKFDLEGNCEIIYEIHHDNLKQISITPK